MANIYLDGNFSITENLFEISKIICPTIIYPNFLELGSGKGTNVWVNSGYNVTTVEHDPQWLNSVKGAEYIHAKLIDKYYDRLVISKILDKKFDVWLIDGPPGYISKRETILEFLHTAKLPKAFIVDDTHRRDGTVIVKNLISFLYSKKLSFISCSCDNMDSKGPAHSGVIIKLV